MKTFTEMFPEFQGKTTEEISALQQFHIQRLEKENAILESLNETLTRHIKEVEKIMKS